jgi:twitching motility protein PilU
MAYEMLTRSRSTHFEEEKEINLSFGIRDIGNFRVNMFWQRGTIAIVVRFIQGEIPKWTNSACPVLTESSWKSAAWCWWSAPPARASPPRWRR